MIMYIYLYRYKSIEGYVNLAIKDFILYYNFVPNRNKGRINEKVYNTLQLMIDKEFIRFVGCFSNGGLALLNDVDCNMLFTVQLMNIDEKWNPQNRFTKVMYSEIDFMRSNNIKPMDKILFFYVNIKKRISSDVEANSANLFAFPSEETLARECGCGISTIKNYTRILCAIGMLFVKNYGSYLKMKRGKEIIKNSNNVYALKEKDIDDNAKETLREYLKLNCGYVDGFYPLCNNLPNNAKVINKEQRSVENWGEPDPLEKDFSVEEILEMKTQSEVNISGVSNSSIKNPITTITIKKPVQKQNIISDDVKIQKYADNLYKQYGSEYEKSIFMVEPAEKFPGLSEYEKYYDSAKKLHDLSV